MPISNSCIQANANALIGAATTRQLAQVSGLLTENSTYSVACIAALPSASDNQGRLIYVTDISAYRYSDGDSWSNCYDTTCRVVSTQIWGWGQNACGELGNNSIASANSEVRESSLSTNWCLITNSSCISVGIKTDGTLWRWGITYTGAGANYSSPVQEQSSSTNWCFARQGGGGVGHGHGIKTDGTLWGWGYNSDGQMGSGAWGYGVTSLVQEVTSSTNWINVAPGNDHSAAVKSDGTLWSMGVNTSGQLGINSTAVNKYSSPIQEITSSTNWCYVGAGNAFVSSLKSDGTIWSWGSGSYAKLGDGAAVNRSSPVQEITSSTNWSILSSVGSSTEKNGAIKTDGTLWGWGNNLYGALGIGTGSGSICTPTQEFCSATNWCLIDVGVDQTVALKTDGTLWHWGRYQCGNVQTGGSNACSPIQEENLGTYWCDATSGLRSILGIKQIIKGFNTP